MTEYSNFALRAARDTAARGNDTPVHYTSQLAARHERGGTIRGETLASQLAAFAAP